MTSFERKFEVLWSQVDSNQHMGNIHYNVFATDARVAFLTEFGLDVKTMKELAIGPVVLSDTVSYLKELSLADKVTVHLKMAGLSDDCGRWKIMHLFYKEDGVLAAKVETLGGFLDLVKRKLTRPPEKISKVFQELEKTEDCQVLPSLKR